MLKLGVNSPVWVRSEAFPDEAWSRGVIETTLGGQRVVVRTEQGESVECAIRQVEYRSSQSGSGNVDDLTALPDLNRPELLAALHERFRHDKVYTYSGTILIAVNPFKQIPGLYSEKNLNRYISAGVERTHLAPHPWSVAGRAWDQMVSQNGRAQSILISGESGAGKTVSTKIVLNYLTAAANQSGTAASDVSRRTKRAVIEANPLMEAFGNAKTLRNDNSSRFGKMIRLHFDRVVAHLESASVEVYLLEKSRVVHQRRGERNYHIFYELESAPQEVLSKLMWPGVENSRYTSMSDCFERDDGVADSEQFKLTLAALKAVGFSEAEQTVCFRLVAAVLHLGNIDFNDAGNDSSVVAPQSRESLEACASLLDVSSEALGKALTSRVLNVGFGGKVMGALRNSIRRRSAGGAARTAESYLKPQTRQEAEAARDGLAQTLYDRMFSWIVQRINKSVKNGAGLAQAAGGYSIGCLDIFGFEVFESNGFEQVLINFTNEQLQNQFNEYVFKLEQQEYNAEGIDWTVIEFPDNSPCIEMIERGVISLVNQECLFPQGSDKGLVQKLYGLQASPFFDVSSAQRGRQCFAIRHFAGDVEYNVQGFCHANKNEVRQETKDLLCESSEPIIKSLMANNGGKTGARAKQAGRLQSETVGTNFRYQLKVLMDQVRASEPHYIRCLKSNDHNVPDVFHRKRVEDQLAYSGVLEAIKVKRAGFSSRLLIQDFATRYECLLLRPELRQGGARRLAQNILEQTSLRMPLDCQIGKTKVFLKPQAYSTLEMQRSGALHQYAVIIQRAFRNWLATASERIAMRKRREQEAQAAQQQREEQEKERRRLSQARHAEKANRQKDQQRKLEERLRQIEERNRRAQEEDKDLVDLEQKIKQAEQETERLRRKNTERLKLEARLAEAEAERDREAWRQRHNAKIQEENRRRRIIEEGEYRRKVLQKENEMRRRREFVQQQKEKIRQQAEKERQRIIAEQQMQEQRRVEFIQSLISQDKTWRDGLNNKGAKVGAKWLQHFAS